MSDNNYTSDDDESISSAGTITLFDDLSSLNISVTPDMQPTIHPKNMSETTHLELEPPMEDLSELKSNEVTFITNSTVNTALFVSDANEDEIKNDGSQKPYNVVKTLDTSLIFQNTVQLKILNFINQNYHQIPNEFTLMDIQNCLNFQYSLGSIQVLFNKWQKKRVLRRSDNTRQPLFTILWKFDEYRTQMKIKVSRRRVPVIIPPYTPSNSSQSSSEDDEDEDVDEDEDGDEDGDSDEDNDDNGDSDEDSDEDKDGEEVVNAEPMMDIEVNGRKTRIPMNALPYTPSNSSQSSTEDENNNDQALNAEPMNESNAGLIGFAHFRWNKCTPNQRYI